MIKKISGVYKITNTITNDFYIGSSKDVKRRWSHHKCHSVWERCPNNQMYLDFQKYGVNKFDFQVIEEVEIDRLKETEQQFIEKLKPTYNDINANGFDVERKKEYMKEYKKSDKWEEYYKAYQNKYKNQLCSYNGEILTLNALSLRFYKSGVAHSTLEAKKYLLNNGKVK